MISEQERCRARSMSFKAVEDGLFNLFPQHAPRMEIIQPDTRHHMYSDACASEGDLKSYVSLNHICKVIYCSANARQATQVHALSTIRGKHPETELEALERRTIEQTYPHSSRVPALPRIVRLIHSAPASPDSGMTVDTIDR